ncbi:MAG TPA: hypothetical protein VM618_11210 [Acidimicrobiia bacterium]|nr:hypothetical protein [Acidimicrobiia bacterium]
MADTEQDALDALADASAGIAAGVRASLPGWAEERVGVIVAAWGRHDDDERERILTDARRAGQAAAERVGAEMDRLFALDPDEQRVTPLQIVRTAYREVTPVLANAGIPPVERDEFDERAFPDDAYGLVPASLRDLGGDALHDLQIRWGVARTTLHHLRRRS